MVFNSGPFQGSIEENSVERLRLVQGILDLEITVCFVGLSYGVKGYLPELDTGVSASAQSKMFPCGRNWW